MGGDRTRFFTAAVCENHVVLVSDDTENLESHINVKVFNVVTKDTWTVGNFGPLWVDYDDILVSISKTLLSITFLSHFNEDGDACYDLKLFSMETREILLEDELYNIGCVRVDLSSSLPLLVILYETNVKVLSFDKDTYLRNRAHTETSCYTDAPLHFDGWQGGNGYSYSNLEFPYMCHFQGIHDDCWEIRNTSAFVWKIDDGEKKVESHKFVADFDTYLRLSEELVAAVHYISSSFVVVSMNRSSTPAALYVIDEGGAPIRKIQLNSLHADLFKNIYKNINVIIDSEMVMKWLYLGELLNPGENNNVSRTSFLELILEYSHSLMDHSTLSSIIIEDKGQMAMEPKIEVIKLDFWAID